MAITQKKIITNDLEVGMFICNLDRPWCETPYPIQGFYIDDASDITKLTGLCHHVYVDVHRAREVDEYNVDSKKTLTKSSGHGKNREVIIPSFSFKRDTYAIEVPAIKEISNAKKIQKDVYQSIDKLMTSVTSDGHVDMPKTRATAKKMVNSVVRNPDAFIWLSRMKSGDAHSYSQSVNASIWGIVFGRHLGLKKAVLESLATGLLLAKIGKVKFALSPREGRTYVDDSLNILKKSPGINNQILTVVAYHQELLNGSGFPRGISGEDIPILGRIASLVNFYEEKTNPSQGNALTPSEAMALIYKVRNRLIQQDLGEEFIKAIGVYPVGTIVELTSNEVGIVMEHNAARKLHPKIMMVLNKKKSMIRRKVILDLFEERDKNNKNPISIRRTLPYGSIGIDLSKLQISGEKTGWGILGWLGFS